MRNLEKSRDGGGTEDGNRGTRIETGSQDAGVVDPDRGVQEQRHECPGLVQGARNPHLQANTLLVRFAHSMTDERP